MDVAQRSTIARCGLVESAMTFDLSRLSPQGWALAVTILACGIAIPFMRSKQKLDGSQEEVLRSGQLSDDRPDSNLAGERHARLSTNQNSRERANSFQLPSKGTIPSPLSAASSQPVATEFPDWARKPSPLDELIESSGHSQSSQTVDPALRKPSPFKTWSGELDVRDHAAELRKSSPDRYSPFRDQAPADPAQTSAIARVVWPDQEISRQGPIVPAAQPDRPVAELVGAKNPATSSGALKDPMIDSGVGSHPRETRTVGASLRSQVVPSRELFICQPGVTP